MRDIFLNQDQVNCSSNVLTRTAAPLAPKTNGQGGKGETQTSRLHISPGHMLGTSATFSFDPCAEFQNLKHLEFKLKNLCHRQVNVRELHLTHSTA